jgi:hypothetical protein
MRSNTSREVEAAMEVSHGGHMTATGARSSTSSSSGKATAASWGFASARAPAVLRRRDYAAQSSQALARRGELSLRRPHNLAWPHRPLAQ